jgi:hypothetical protein
MNRIVLVFVLNLLGVGFGVAQQALYSRGAFSPGRVYNETDLDALDGTPLSTPAYLVGKFPYVRSLNGLDYFTTSGLSVHIVIAVKFFNNRPPGLAVGKAIVATPEEPLTLIHVGRLTNGVLLVVTESWSKP